MPAEAALPAASGSPRDTPLRAVLVTLAVCLVCSALVSSAVVVLRPYQVANRQRDRLERIRDLAAEVPGLERSFGALGAGRIETRVVELSAGRYADELDPELFDPREAARDPAQSVEIPAERDLAGIGRRARYARVHLVRDGRELRLLVLPVHGAGYLSTLYGYLALDPDGNTVRGLGFYEHAETPGLGSEVDNPEWRAQWRGKRVRDPGGALRLRVSRGRVEPGDPDAPYAVDGISGATRTAQGVQNLLRFWLGPDGFGPWLARLGEE